MKLASLKEGGRDGTLVVVSRDLKRMVRAAPVAATLQQALDRWEELAPRLAETSRQLNAGSAAGVGPFDPAAAAAPLPRAYQWLDGSTFLNHMTLMRKARGAEMPPERYTDPCMYQGASDTPAGARDPILLEDEAWGGDFEAEVVIVTGDVPMGIAAAGAERCIRLFMLANDVSFSGLEKSENAKGMGFLQSKPSTAFSPVAVTPDELGPAWKDGKVHLPLLTHLNGTLFGRPNAGVEMAFNFPRLIQHAAKTRRLATGTIIGSGTVSNSAPDLGSSSIGERRALEIVTAGAAKTRFLRFGDRVRMEMLDAGGASVFGAIEQEVVHYRPPRA